ncbi:P22 phage major capsid protein family protein [Diaphorobacter nitroreducens]
MPNSILTPTAVTREALRILHQKLNFVGRIKRDYDDSFAKTGAKIGDSLKIRLPNEYTVRTGATLSAQDTSEISTTLQVATQKGVDLNFTSVDLTLSLDDFSKRILDPAMSVLAANIEADALNMMLDVYQNVNNIGSALTFKRLMESRKVLNDSLAPMDNDRTVLLNTNDNVDLVDALKGLFQDSTAIREQYREGSMGRTGGYDFYENTLIGNQLTGTAAAATGYTVNGAVTTNGSTTVTLAAGATTFKKGDIITFVGCNRVHPETKADTGVLQQFVVTADYAGGAGNISVSPAIYTSGGRQNVVAAGIANGVSVAKVGAASGIYKPSLAFHKDAFAFATADLVMPGGVDFASRQVLDGISMRIVRQYDINNDKFPCRLDVLYGYKTIRPQLACRILSN